MGRALLIVALIYCYGDPGFDGHRPLALDRPLRHLHRTVDIAAANVQRVLVALDNNTREISTLATRLRHLSDALL